IGSYAAGMARTAQLARQDGVLVHPSDPTKRYLGSVLVGPASTAIDFGGSTSAWQQMATRLLWNQYNRVPKGCTFYNNNNVTWNGNGAWQEYALNAGGFGRFLIFVGGVDGQTMLTHSLAWPLVTAGGGVTACGPTLDGSESGDLGGGRVDFSS